MLMQIGMDNLKTTPKENIPAITAGIFMIEFISIHNRRICKRLNLSPQRVSDKQADTPNHFPWFYNQK